MYPTTYMETHAQTWPSGMAIVIITKVVTVVTQPLYLYGEYCSLLIFSRNKTPVKGESNISVITD